MSWQVARAVLLLWLHAVADVHGYRDELPLDQYAPLESLIGPELAELEQELSVAAPEREAHWPRRLLPQLGQVSGVAVDLADRPQLLHRANVTWQRSSFNDTHHYQHAGGGPIAAATLLTLDRTTGAVVKAELAGRLYLPHGLHIDNDGNRWVTDVALHQVFKLPPDSDEPELILGEAFQPGYDSRHFCKPADVAVSEDGTIFVADGYCNSRVMAFSEHGRFLANFGRGVALRVPHSLAVWGSMLVVADRERGRLVSWDIRRPFLEPRITSLALYGRLFAVTVAGDVLYTVHQSDDGAGALTIDAASGIVLSTWGLGLESPHDIAVNSDASDIYVGETEPHRISKFLSQPEFYERP